MRYDEDFFRGLELLHRAADIVDQHAGSKIRLECLECGAHFSRKVGPRTYEIKCPKCHSYDVEPE